MFKRLFVRYSLLSIMKIVLFGLLTFFFVVAVSHKGPLCKASTLNKLVSTNRYTYKKMERI